MMASRMGTSDVRSSSNSRAAQRSLAEAYTTGKSSCDSSASNATKRSKTSSSTASGRASGRSTLLMTTMGARPWDKALRSTKRVWGMGPS